MVSSHFDTHDDRYLNDPEFKKVCDEENRRKFKERQAMEEPEPTSGFRIIVPCVEPLLTRFLYIPCTTRAQPVHIPCTTRAQPPIPSLRLDFRPPAWYRITPFGMPEYDGGERFDLRLPYVDNGWVDEDADPGT